MKRIVKWTGISLLGLMAALLLTIVIAGMTAPDLRSGRAAGGQMSNSSFYLTTTDGVRLAVDVWLPREYNGGKIPTLVHLTRYWRAMEPNFLAHALIHLRLFPRPEGAAEPFSRAFLRAGYAVVAVDSRGTGASEGNWPILFGPQEIADLIPVFDWIIRQPWSNQRIGTYGISYPGFTAELAALTGHPSLKAVAPLFVYWDVSQDVMAGGGIFNEGLIHTWSTLTDGLDHGEPCPSGEFSCRLRSLGVAGVKPVDADRDGEMLSRIMRARHNMTVAKGLESYEFRGDRYFGTQLSIDDVAPAAHRDELAQSNIPYYAMTGWYDADGTLSTLRRFHVQSNPQDVIIGPWSHGGRFNTDPFAAPDAPGVLPREAVTERIIKFFDAHLRAASAASGVRRVTYYVNGGGIWRTTDSWPRADTPRQRWYFAADNVLASAEPADSVGSDRYVVDFTSSTGERSRFHTVVGGGDVIYADRREQDERLLTYTSPAFQTDMEIGGVAAATIRLSASTPDAALHVYLEDVDQSGAVTYITEGRLRLMDRAAADSDPFGGLLGPQHSFERRDAKPLVPGETVTAEIGLQPIAAVVRKGHRLRIAIAGFDGTGFRRIPATGTPVLQIERNAVSPSFVEVPMIPFDPTTGSQLPPR